MKNQKVIKVNKDTFRVKFHASEKANFEFFWK